MGLNPPGRTGLRTIHHNARRTSKVGLHIPPGDRLEVSDDVAGQLLAESAQFVDITDQPPAPEPEVAEPVKKPAAKKTTKKAAKKAS